VKVYNSVAARMLGEFRRTALALRVYPMFGVARRNPLWRKGRIFN
jgi:hypothetical protein